MTSWSGFLKYSPIIKNVQKSALFMNFCIKIKIFWEQDLSSNRRRSFQSSYTLPGQSLAQTQKMLKICQFDSINSKLHSCQFFEILHKALLPSFMAAYLVLNQKRLKYLHAFIVCCVNQFEPRKSVFH